MNQAGTSSNFWLLCTLLLALLLEIIPWLVLSDYWRPQWVLLVALFWAQRRPLQYGVTMAFLAGLALDVTLGGVVGRYALTTCLCVYFLKAVQKRMHYSTVIHQSLLVFVLAVFNGMMVNGIDQLFLNVSVAGRSPFYSALVTACLWPLLRWPAPRLPRAG